ncbi:MAG: hypothetical protein V1816_00600 [Pseudomonadota bacterium]
MAELRRFLRASTEYRIEYGPFPFLGREDELKSSIIKNLGGGGLMFRSSENFSEGKQLMLKIFIKGWRLEGDDLVEGGESSEAPITAIAEVRRSEFDSSAGCYKIGVQFLGRIMD